MQDVAEHFRIRWHEVTGETLPPVAGRRARGDLELQIVRTVPEKVYSATAARRLQDPRLICPRAASAERLIYLENQFLWSPEIAALLTDKLRTHPTPISACCSCCPARPNSGGDDTRGVLGELIEADADAGRLLACTLYARSGRLVDPVYVHAKVGVVDDAWLTVGSANLNEHSFFNDTEMNVVSHDPGLALGPDSDCGRSTSSSTATGSPPTRRSRSTSSGSRSARSSSTAGTPAAADAPARAAAERLARSGPRLGPISGLLVDG